MKRLILTALLLLIASSCYAASSADENFHSGREESSSLYHPDKSDDEELAALITEYVPKFKLRTYSDDVTGKAIKYSIYLPDGYSAEKKYPVVFFIADGSAAGKAPEFSLTQGYGGLIWCRNDCVVIVPSYPEVVLDDHNGFVLSDYVEITGRFVDYAVKNYSIDEKRVYATGQSMGCMTLLVLAAKNTGMFTACLFVSGQWDINALRGLTVQRFIYVASAGDPKASAGQQEVIDMFRSGGVPYASYVNINAKNTGLTIPGNHPQSFITFKEKSTLPEGTEGTYSEHMTSFDYAYRIKSVREWLLSQVKGD